MVPLLTTLHDAPHHRPAALFFLLIYLSLVLLLALPRLDHRVGDEPSEVVVAMQGVAGGSAGAVAEADGANLGELTALAELEASTNSVTTGFQWALITLKRQGKITCYHNPLDSLVVKLAKKW